MKIFIVTVTECDSINCITGAFTCKDAAKYEILFAIKQEYEESIEDIQTMADMYSSRFNGFLRSKGYITRLCGRVKDKNIRRPHWNEVEYIFADDIDKYSECDGIVSHYKIVEEELEL